jgi:hypothetical protein
MIYKIKQVFNYLFPKLKENDISVIKNILNIEEQEVFFDMSLYDQKHSYNVLKGVIKNELLREDNLYRRLALLHDCGKSKELTFKERMEYTLLKKGRVHFHPKRGFDKLNEIDYKLALMVLKHHNKNIDNEK